MPRRSSLPIVYVEMPIPACPFCSCTNHETERSTDQGDGSRYCRMVCRGCRKKFVKIVEFVPNFGITEEGTL